MSAGCYCGAFCTGGLVALLECSVTEFVTHGSDKPISAAVNRFDDVGYTEILTL